MVKARKHMAVIICISLLLVSFLSPVFIAKHADHDCRGEHCQICGIISHLGNTLKQLGTAVVAIAAVLATAYCLSSTVPLQAISVRQTPVTLKVQLNN